MKKLFLDFCNKNGLKVEDMGVAGYFCMTPEQRAAAREKQRMKIEQSKHQDDESILSPTMKLIMFKTIF